jgi:hypothetical protein
MGGASGNGGASGMGGGGTGGMASATTFRYARLVALSEVDPADPFTSVAELELLDQNGQSINRSGWTVSVDSEETEDEVAPATNAIDGDINTYWHTDWYQPGGTGGGDPLPHYIQVDLGSAQEITGFEYTPRQGGNGNGRIVGYEFYLSNTATNPGTSVVSGSFADPTAVQTVMLP